MKLIINSKDLHEYQFALMVVRNHQPLLALDDNLELYPEIIALAELLDKVEREQARPYRGQRKVTINIPETIQTHNLNKALRYSFEQCRLIHNPKQEGLRALDKAYAIALAGLIAPVVNKG